MQAPTSRYGCGDESCVACYGDAEYRREREIEYLNDLAASGEIDHEQADRLLRLEAEEEDGDDRT